MCVEILGKQRVLFLCSGKVCQRSSQSYLHKYTQYMYSTYRYIYIDSSFSGILLQLGTYQLDSPRCRHFPSKIEQSLEKKKIQIKKEDSKEILKIVFVFNGYKNHTINSRFVTQTKTQVALNKKLQELNQVNACFFLYIVFLLYFFVVFFFAKQSAKNAAYLQRLRKLCTALIVEKVCPMLDSVLCFSLICNNKLYNIYFIYVCLFW